MMVTIFNLILSTSKWRMPLPAYFKVSLGVILVCMFYAIFVGTFILAANKGRYKPGRFLRLNIALVSKFNHFVKENIGKHWQVVAPQALALGMYIALANLTGLLALQTPTQKLSITIALAIYAMFVVQITGLVARKFKHFKTLFEPVLFMFPINLMGDFTPVISMSLRLFGNIVAGGMIMGMVYGFTKWASVIIAPLLHLVFDIGFGFIQTLVFVTLTIMFASNKIEVGDVDPQELVELQNEKAAKKAAKQLKKLKKLKGEIVVKQQL